MMAPLLIDNKEVVVVGRFIGTAKLKAEYFEWVDDPLGFLAKMSATGEKIDLFTFLQRISDESIRYNYCSEWDGIAVLPITTYEVWWKKQINDKTRNMIRKAQKSGVEVRPVEFSDDLIRGIKEIYDESPIRQGKPFKHYGKDFETLKKDHISFLNRSQFIGTYYKDELIGFVKLVHDEGLSHLMQIIAKIHHRDKAPTNALIAKAVEICAQRSVPYLHYGIWSKRGLGDLKKHHAFECFNLRRYFVPLNWRGKLILKLKLHRHFSDRIPGILVDFLVSSRSKWNSLRYGLGRSDRAVTRMGGRHN
jgi:hypothetical protein